MRWKITVQFIDILWGVWDKLRNHWKIDQSTWLKPMLSTINLVAKFNIKFCLKRARNCISRFIRTIEKGLTFLVLNYHYDQACMCWIEVDIFMMRKCSFDEAKKLHWLEFQLFYKRSSTSDGTSLNFSFEQILWKFEVIHKVDIRS